MGNSDILHLFKTIVHYCSPIHKVYKMKKKHHSITRNKEFYLQFWRVRDRHIHCMAMEKRVEESWGYVKYSKTLWVLVNPGCEVDN